MVRASVRYKYISKMPCEWSTHSPAPGQCSTSRDKKNGGLMGQTGEEKCESPLSHALALPGWGRDIPDSERVRGCAHSTGDICERILSYTGINLEPDFLECHRKITELWTDWWKQVDPQQWSSERNKDQEMKIRESWMAWAFHHHIENGHCTEIKSRETEF